MAAEPGLSRRALSQRVCGWLGWQGAHGKPPTVGCRKALLRLERAGRLDLPSAQPWPAPRPERSGTTPPPVAQIAASLAAVRPVRLVRIDAPRSAAAAAWKGLMDAHHPLGSGPLCGAGIRYQIVSDRFGLLGGMAFSSAAWRLRARDRWIGWDDATRAAHLPQVVNQSRFLIAPGVAVPHLASHVLALALQQLAGDWEARYGVKPVLVETFVDPEAYAGTGYRAANWTDLGLTAGRGRCDRDHRHPVSRKRVYAYPLVRSWRRKLGVDGPVSVPVRDWAVVEVGEAQLGDRRRTDRLVRLLRDFYARPHAQIPEACGSRAARTAAYRFFAHPHTTMDPIFRAHAEATRDRLRRHRVVLAVQDSTSLNYTGHPATDGLGPIGTQAAKARGLWVHDTMTFTPEGTPLGLVDVQCWTRDPKRAGGRATRHLRETDAKESAKWLTSFAAVAKLQGACPRTLLVSVADREGDLYPLWQQALEPGAPKLLVRARHDRKLADTGDRLYAYLAGRPVAGGQTLALPRRHGKPARVAHMEIRYAAVRLAAPKTMPTAAPVPAWAVWTREIDPPAGETPLEWRLLTTVPVETLDDACERIAWYTQRWTIESYHRVLKSGCRIQDRQLGTAQRIQTCLAIDMIVAWRVFHLTKQARETPTASCTEYFDEASWKALVLRVRGDPAHLETPPTLDDAVRMVARLGGYLGRKQDPPPGPQTTWRGLQRLDDLTHMYRLLTHGDPRAPPTVPSRGYG